jgi:hypothetical protein
MFDLKRSSPIVIAACIVLLAVARTHGAVPEQISFQGRLADSGGNPLDGTYSITFTIYSVPSGGSSIWNETLPSVNVDNGLFSVQLGGLTPLTEFVFADSERYLGISVEGGQELDPRIHLTNMPWSFKSAISDSVTGGPFVKASGDTVNGTLSVIGNLSAGTDSIEAPITLRTRDNWAWWVGNGLGDVRIGDGVRGLSIGVASGGGGAGHVRFWPSGGSQLVTFASPAIGDQLTIDGNNNHVWAGSPFSVGTDSSLAKLTVRADGNWRWDIGSGNGDFRMETASGMGFSVGIAAAGGGAGAVRLWPSGGSQLVTLGSPTSGDQLTVDGNLDLISTGSPLSVNTTNNLAPLTVRSANNWRWDVGTGNGDFRLSDSGGRGLSIGVGNSGLESGVVRFWPSGGTFPSIAFGSPGFGDIVEVLGTGDVNFSSINTRWASSGNLRILVRPADGRISVHDSTGSMRGAFGGDNSGNVQLFNDSDVNAAIFSGGGDGGGSLRLNRSDGNISADFRGGGATSGQGGILQMYDGTGSFFPTMGFFGHLTGDASVELPDSAISSSEILNEAGIAANRSNGVFSLNSTSTMQDLITATITIPTQGYVFLYGHCWIEVSGTTLNQGGYIQIDETSGGDIVAPYHSFSGNSAFFSTTNHWWSTSNQRVYFKTAGTYTFRLEGKRWTSNGSASVWHPVLTSIFLPTSYGPVTTMVSSAEVGDFESANAVIVSGDDSPHSGNNNPQYRVDLRELELRAERLQSQADNARHELQAAQLRKELAAVKGQQTRD